MLQNFMRLDDLLARDVTVQWFEGVALVQSVCSGLEAGAVRGGGFPAESDIVLSPDGSVGILALRADEGAVSAAARVLARMLTDDVPVRLRLLVTEATAGTVYTTVGELSEALAYFERPDREGILRGLYERASRAEARHDLLPQPARPELTSELKALTQESRPQKKRSAAVAVLTTMGVVACAVISWAALRAPEGSSVSSVIKTAQEAVRASLGTPEPEEAAAPVEAEDRAKPAPPRRTRNGASRTTAAATPLTLAPLPPKLLLERSALSGMLSPLGALDNVFYSSVDVTAVSAEDLEARQRQIYSAINADVVPPRSVYPKLPANPPSAIGAEDKTILDMVIDTNGLVEGVRLRTPPRNIHEFMLLSAVKAWRFEPAQHPDGYPVRFRHSVVISLQ